MNTTCFFWQDHFKWNRSQSISTYKWDLDLSERLYYCCCLDFQPLLLTFRPLLAIPACFKSPKRDNCLLVYVVSTLTLCVLHMYLSDAAVHVSILDWKVFPNFNWNNLTSQWKFVTFPISGLLLVYKYLHFFQCLHRIWNLILFFLTAWHNSLVLVYHHFGNGNMYPSPFIWKYIVN